MKPGSQWVFRETDGRRLGFPAVVVTVLDKYEDDRERRRGPDRPRSGNPRRPRSPRTRTTGNAQDAPSKPLVPSAKTRPSTKTGSRRRRRAPGRLASTGRFRGSSCPRARMVGMTYREEYYKGPTRRTAPPSSRPTRSPRSRTDGFEKRRPDAELQRQSSPT
jgi:hypothetical protein